MKNRNHRLHRLHRFFLFFLCVPLCNFVANFLVIFMVAIHDVVRVLTRRRMKTDTTGLRSIEGPRAAWFHGRQKGRCRHRPFTVLIQKLICRTMSWSSGEVVSPLYRGPGCFDYIGGQFAPVPVGLDQFLYLAEMSGNFWFLR
jgi:hypothetical protein